MPRLPLVDVFDLVYSPDGAVLHTAAEDNLVRCWDARTGSPCALPAEHNGSVTAVAALPDGRHLASGSLDGLVRIWTLPVPPPATVVVQLGEPVRKLIVPRDRGPLVVAGSGGRVATCSLSPHPGTRLFTLPPLRDLSVTPDGAVAWSADGSGTLRSWNLRDGTARAERVQAGVPVTAVAADAASLACGTAAGAILYWSDLRRGPAQLRAGEGASVVSLDFRPQSGRLVNVEDGIPDRCLFACVGPTVVLFDLYDRGDRRPQPRTLTSAVGLVGVTAAGDASRFLLGGEDNVARIWDARMWRPIGHPLEHEATVRAVALSPDNRLALTCSNDRTARLWDVATGQPVSPPLPHPAPVTAGTFLPDGRTFVTGDAGGTVRLWPSPQPLPGDPVEIERRLEYQTGYRLDLSTNHVGIARPLTPADHAARSPR